MVPLIEVSMLNESRREHFTLYTEMLKERFRRGMLAELQPLNQWVVWRAELEDQKQKKVPYNPHLHLVRASVKIPKSWGTLDQAVKALETGNYSGLGFMITPPLVMIDLDNSYDRATQTITSPQAEEIMKAVPTYFEASPYKGLKGLVYVGRPIRNVHTDAIEIYGYDRFTTITTDHIPGTPTTIELRTREVEALYHQFVTNRHPTLGNTRFGVGGEATSLRIVDVSFPEPSLPEKPDEQVITEALQEERSNFARYWNGDPSLWTPPAPDVKPERKSKSEAFFVLLAMLLTRTRENVEQVKRLYWQSPFARGYQKAGERAGKDPRTGADVTHLDLAIYNAIKKRGNPPQRR